MHTHRTLPLSNFFWHVLIRHNKSDTPHLILLTSLGNSITYPNEEESGKPGGVFKPEEVTEERNLSKCYGPSSYETYSGL